MSIPGDPAPRMSGSWYNRFYRSTPDIPPGPSGILPTDQRIICNRCDTDQPMGSIVLLRDYALRTLSDGKRVVVSEVTGERVSCQVCGHSFTISPRGKFVQHPDALPFSPQPARRQEQPPEKMPSPDGGPTPPAIRRPLARPSV